MNELAKFLPEYPIVCSMSGVGSVLSLKLISETEDVRRFHSGKALVAYAGIEAPPYQSGQFIGTKRKISKRGSSNLRKIGYEVMRCLKTLKNSTDRSNKIKSSTKGLFSLVEQIEKKGANIKSLKKS